MGCISVRGLNCDWTERVQVQQSLKHEKKSGAKHRYLRTSSDTSSRATKTMTTGCHYAGSRHDARDQQALDELEPGTEKLK